MGNGTTPAVPNLSQFVSTVGDDRGVLPITGCGGAMAGEPRRQAALSQPSRRSAGRPVVMDAVVGRSTVLLGLWLCVAALVLAACGPSSTTPATTSQTLPSASTTPSVSRVTADVLAAYRTMWANLVTAAETSDYQSPLLSQHASGAALSLLVQGLARDQLHGIVTRGETIHYPRVTSLSPSGIPTRASIADCFDDTRWLEYKTSGGLAKNTPGGRRAAAADVVKTAGTWKVSQITVRATGTC
jgi:hypothetical protein